MVLGDLLDIPRIRQRPWELFFIGLLYSSVAIMIALAVFKDHASLVMIFLTVLASIHIIYNLIKIEEEKDVANAKESLLLKEHAKTLSAFVMLFAGFAVSFSLWYVFLPDAVAQALFTTQISAIQQINTATTGSFINAGDTLARIFFNNLRVLAFCLLFAFFYGFGAIFILAWNASVVGAAIGGFIKSGLNQGFLSAFSMGIMRYFTHGIPEILAYFTAGLAGGIISIAIIRHQAGTLEFRKVLIDSADLTLLSVALLGIAALIEVFVTPLFF
ncbi:stage II sporulation protein M [Candidatus Woesearchaeota archaeon]|nr:stage II sporulation protein M [Candidatus Woesearchaeota archaeon]